MSPPQFRAVILAVALAAALTLAACADLAPTDPSSSPDARSGSPPALAAAEDATDPNVLGRRVPGFGGFFFDQEGRPTAYLQQPAHRSQLEEALSRFLLAEGLDASSLRVLPADFDLLRLDGWFAKAAPVALSLTGAVYADLDEASNRLRIGAEPAALEAIRSRVARLGIPPAAVIVEEATPVRPLATLQDAVRPLVGGLEINYTGGWRCTLGFNARVSGVNSFITASHCSIRYGSTDPTSYTQPGGSAVGTEIFDPPFFAGGACPRGRRCRYSDATRAAYAPRVPFTLGEIARPAGVNDGSLEITGSISIVRKSSGSAGSTANKIGRTTGWSQGSITRTCVATNVLATNVTLLCQHWVAGAVDEGDSGAPVFIGSGRGVALAGVLWGGDVTGTTFIFSPIANIERELGSLSTF